jgi:hypothetical protein
MTTKPEPPAKMPANMYKERVTHWLKVGDMKPVLTKPKEPKIDYSKLVQ